MSSGVIRRLNQGGGGVMDAARCPACGHPARIHNVVGCVSGPCECMVTRAELMPDAPRLEAPDGVESTPAAPPSEPTPPPVAAAPAPAAAPPAAPEPIREPPAPRPVAELPPLPGAGVPRTAPMPGEVATPDADVARQVDDIVAAGKAAPYRRPRLHTARPAAPALGVERAADGEPDAAEEVAVASTSATAAGPAAHWDPPKLPPVPGPPEPFDFEPFLARALYVSSRWYCPRCHWWPLDPGACPGCRKPLQAVYHVTIPRETP